MPWIPDRREKFRQRPQQMLQLQGRRESNGEGGQWGHEYAVLKGYVNRDGGGLHKTAH